MTNLPPQLCVMQQCELEDCLNNCATRHVLEVDSSDRYDKFPSHLVNLLSEWTAMFPYDFRCEKMMKQLRDVTQRVLQAYPHLRKDINALSYNLVTKVTLESSLKT